jgi:hypothetical protein
MTKKHGELSPMKVYVNREDKTYKNLIMALQKEGSLLGSDTDKDGKFYLIIDETCSSILKQRLENKKC